MRNILFRGKDTVTGEWVYGDLIHRIVWTKPMYIIRTFDNGFDIYKDYDVYPESVAQFTGLHDKNDKKIFEGDIFTNEKGDIGRVTWYDEYSAFMIFSITKNKVYWLYDNDFSMLLYIGNIHDNPELLKEGAEG